jgi:hypothetical protein
MGTQLLQQLFTGIACVPPHLHHQAHCHAHQSQLRDQDKHHPRPTDWYVLRAGAKFIAAAAHAPAIISRREFSMVASP